MADLKAAGFGLAVLSLVLTAPAWAGDVASSMGVNDPPQLEVNNPPPPEVAAQDWPPGQTLICDVWDHGSCIDWKPAPGTKDPSPSISGSCRVEHHGDIMIVGPCKPAKEMGDGR